MKNKHLFWHNKFYFFSIPVPSQPPSGFTVVTSTSTSITTSWQLPPENARNGNIKGFKLLYKKKDSVGPPLNLIVNGGENRIKEVTGLAKYTEYEFQVLAFTSVGDGPKSSIKVERTKEDGKNLLTDTLITNSIPFDCRRIHQDVQNISTIIIIIIFVH